MWSSSGLGESIISDSTKGIATFTTHHSIQHFVRMNTANENKNYLKLVAEQTSEYLRELDFKAEELLDDGDRFDLDNTVHPGHPKIVPFIRKTHNARWNIADNTP